MKTKLLAIGALLMLTGCSSPVTQPKPSPTSNAHKCADILVKSWTSSKPDPFIVGCVSDQLKSTFAAQGLTIDENFMVGAKLYSGEIEFVGQYGNMVVYRAKLVPNLPIPEMIMVVWLDDNGLVLDYGYGAPLNI